MTATLIKPNFAARLRSHQTTTMPSCLGTNVNQGVNTHLVGRASSGDALKLMCAGQAVEAAPKFRRNFRMSQVTFTVFAPSEAQSTFVPRNAMTRHIF